MICRALVAALRMNAVILLRHLTFCRTIGSDGTVNQEATEK